MENENSQPVLSNCTFTINAATNSGGGMENDNSSPTVTSSIFNGNTASTSGGGVFSDNQNAPVMTSCIFRLNSATTGGGMYNYRNSPAQVSNCTFGGNTANFGGGMYNNGSTSTLANCIFSGNTSEKGGGMYNFNASPVITNSSFGGNSAGYDGGGLYNDGTSAPIVKNTIFRGDFKTGDLSVSEIYGGPMANFTYCCIQGGSGTYTATGNIFGDPAFVDANGADNIYGTSDDNFRLGNSSPCIGTGTASGAPAADIEGATRGTPPDMGAYENNLNTSEITIIYVSANATGTNNGTSWTHAYTSLQVALNAAVAYDQVWVAKGTYKPSQPYNLTLDGNRDFHFRMINNVTIYGGFAGTETNIIQRMNYGVGQVNESILSGDIGSTGVVSDNCYHLFYHPEELALSNSAKLDGFTITGGFADYGSGPGNTHSCGAGMYNYKASPSISNCAFTENESYRYGGGMCNENTSYPELTNCTFTGNTAINGGGMFNDHSLPTLFQCQFIGNDASLGGGIHSYYSSPVITNCTFKINLAYEGGGIFNDNSSPTATNCLFAGNTATFGGGVFNLNLSNSALINCTFSLNHANDYGGGIQIDFSSSSVLQNCILWGNTSVDGGKQIFVTDGSITLNTCCYANGTGDILTNGTGTVNGTGNVFSNPLFADPINGNFHLSAGSSCISTGLNPAAGNLVPSTDLSGFTRPLGSGTDMGVFECFDDASLPDGPTPDVDISKPLSAGWTWFSVNVSGTDMLLDKVLSSLKPTDGDYIKNQTVSATFYDGFGWFGELTQINPKEMYKIKLAKADVLLYTGTPVDPATNPITIKNGWNWIGYLPQLPQPLSSALTSINPIADDYIKNQTSSSTYYDGFGWFGELLNLEPLDGYMLKTSHTGTLIYQE